MIEVEVSEWRGARAAIEAVTGQEEREARCR